MRLEHKIVLIIFATLALSFTLLIWFNVARETESLTRIHSQGSDLAVGSMVAGIRNVMLTGEGTYAREIVDEVRRNEDLEIADLKIYNKDGVEVYHYVDFRHSREPTPDSLALAVIEGRREGNGSRAIHGDVGGQPAEIWLAAIPGDSLQDRIGAVRLALDLGAVEYLYGEDLYNQITRVPAEAIVQGYKTIMRSGKADHMTTYARTSGQLPGVVSLQVFNNEGKKTKFGDDALPVDQNLSLYLFEALGGVQVGYREPADPRIYTQLFPLFNEPSCYPCHGRDHLMRGVIRLSVNTSDLEDRQRLTRIAGDMAQSAVANTIYCVIEFGGKDIFVRDYVRYLSDLPEILEVALFCPNGRPIIIEDMPSVSANRQEAVRQVLETVRPLRMVEARGDSGRFLTNYVPVENGVQCWQCHSDDHRVRAVIEISRSLRDIDRQVSLSRRFTIVAGILTIVVIWLALNILMRRVVVRPVNRIVEVVRQVGGGNFQIRAQVENRDEIGFLAAQINEMVEGLMRKFHLEKFVSQATIEAVDHAGQTGVRLGGMRRDVVVLFSDIRGFTSFSEHIPPEQVVSMLNVYLRAQARVVNAHAGQIDKYVGDELVAVFLDDQRLDRAAHRALDCAKQIQRILHKLRETGRFAKVEVGIGINVGPVVMGAIGTEERMDYTVIGDTVNVGARLCAAAAPGRIVVSEAVQKLLDRDGGGRHVFVPVKPLHLKGKSQPMSVYEVFYDLTDPAGRKTNGGDRPAES